MKSGEIKHQIWSVVVVGNASSVMLDLIIRKIILFLPFKAKRTADYAEQSMQFRRREDENSLCFTLSLHYKKPSYSEVKSIFICMN